MFDFLFGWRKASTCKKLIRHVQCRLKILKNKRESIIRVLEDDIVQLIKKGDDHIAFSRIEQLIKDTNIKDVYDQLDNFGEFIILQLPYIRKHKDCPNDISEAVSSLLFASARFGDLPELQKLRKLFGERYGNKFSMTAVELLPGNLVNKQIVEKLCMKSVSYDVKFRLLKETARLNNLQLRPPDIDSRFLLEYHPKENKSLRNSELDSGQSACNDIGGVQLETSKNKGVQGKLDVSQEGALIPYRSSTRSNNVRDNTHESLSPIYERTFVYLDDIEEVQPSVKEDNDEDQRLFMFNLTTPHVNNIYGDCRRASKDKKSSRKKLDRRYVSTTSSEKGIEYALYYGEGGDFSLGRRHFRQRKHQYNRSVEKSQISSFNSSGKKLGSFFPGEDTLYKETGQSSLSHKYKYGQRRMYDRSDFKHSMACDCSLEHPCYFSTSYKNIDPGNLSLRRSSRTTRFVDVSHFQQSGFHFTPCEEAFSTEVMNSSSSRWTITKAANSDERRKPGIVIPFENHIKNEQSKEIEEIDLSYNCPASVASSSGSCKATPSAQNLWIVSCSSQQHNNSNNGSLSCRHVHPKLPDYDDLVSKFMALKIEYVQNSSCQVTNRCGR